MAHTFPLLATLASIFTADIILLETDWWLNLDVAVAYVVTNYTICKYYDVGQVYYLTWGELSQGIQAYEPIFTAFLFLVLAVSAHLMLALITQTLHQNYESDFEKRIQDEIDAAAAAKAAEEAAAAEAAAEEEAA